MGVVARRRARVVPGARVRARGGRGPVPRRPRRRARAAQAVRRLRCARRRPRRAHRTRSAGNTLLVMHLV